MKITINEKDIAKKYSDSGALIDELAYSAGEWTSSELYENNMDYEPVEPYQFDFEADLLANTKKLHELRDLTDKMKFEFPIGTKVDGARPQTAGAQIALYSPEAFTELLQAYTEAVKEQHGSDTILSPQYEKELQEAKDSFSEDQLYEWLFGDYRDYAGVMKMIAKYYGAESVDLVDRKQPFMSDITFTFDDEQIEEIKSDNDFDTLTEQELQQYIINSISDASYSKHAEHKRKSEARRLEHEKEQAYKAERAKQAEEVRKAKLLAMTK
jgi:hypothetical protein